MYATSAKAEVRQTLTTQRRVVSVHSRRAPCILHYLKSKREVDRGVSSDHPGRCVYKDGGWAALLYCIKHSISHHSFYTAHIESSFKESPLQLQGAIMTRFITGNGI
jgi:hypothetical protein